MKKIITSVLVGLAILGTVLNISSCGKEESKPPLIEFWKSTSSTTYISKDTSLVHGTVFNIGINAAKTGTEGLLTSLKISRSINGAPDSTLLQANFIYQYFSQVYSYAAGDSGNLEKYTFTIGEQDGGSNSVSVLITDI